METEVLSLLSEKSDLTLYVLFSLLAFTVFLIAIMGIIINAPLRRTLLTVSFVASLGLGYVSLGELLSRPKPVGIMTWDRPDVEKAIVLAKHLVEGKAIYMLLHYEGIEVPRYYQFPWNKEMAEKLQRAEQAMRGGSIAGIEIIDPFQPSLEDRKFPDIHEIPWPKPPDKEQPDREIIDLDKLV